MAAACQARLLVLLLAALLVAPAYSRQPDVPPAYDTVRQNYESSDVQVMDRHGLLLDRIRRDYQARRGAWLPLSDISPALVRAVIQSEDHRFYEHEGVDWQAVAGAAWSTIIEGRTRGASTLSMQLVTLLDSRLARSGRRSMVDKLRQVERARMIEQAWSKSQILEAYLNLAPFRGELIGVDALAQGMFQKQASGLTMQEGALAAAQLRSPNASLAVLVRRSCQVLMQLGQAQECEGLLDFVRHSLQHGRRPWIGQSGQAPHFSRLALATLNPPRHESLSDEPFPAVRTTLDIGLQNLVADSLDRHLRSLSQANVRDGAAVVLDNATGEILAYVGSSGDLSHAPHVDHARALRQAGSTLKPFLYAQALQEQRLTAASLLDNGRLSLPAGGGLYIPQNYDKQFSGWVSVRVALASSLNIPAVRVLTMVGPAAFTRTLVRLGLPLDRSGDFYGYSLALGSADVTLLSLTNAYRALANGGRYSPVRFVDYRATETAKAEQKVLDAGASWIVGNILSDRQARARTFGFDSPLSTAFWSAVKTGTSKDMRDNWTLGWTQKYTVGVWVGNSEGASMQDVSGVSGAGPVWQDIVRALHHDHASAAPPAPDDLQRLTIHFDNALEPPREEWFMAGSGVTQIRLARQTISQGLLPHIAAPSNGTVLAMDPDIPAHNQRLALRAEGLSKKSAANFTWMLNDQALGQGKRLEWQLRPGRHAIQLLDPDGQRVDQVVIQVRAGPHRSGSDLLNFPISDLLHDEGIYEN